MDSQALHVLNQLLLLSTEELAKSLTIDELEACRSIVEERIKELTSNNKVIAEINDDNKKKTKKSRWDSDTDDEEEILLRKHKKQQRKQKRTRSIRSLSCTTCRSISCYSLEEKLSEGTYGIVWQGIDLETKEKVALKQVRLGKKDCENGFPLAGLRETSILFGLKHPNIVHVREMVVGERDDEDLDGDLDEGYPPFNVFMVMDYWSRDLRSVMADCLLDRPFHQSEVKLLMSQLLAAVQHMHDHHYMHRDLKTANILYGYGGRIAVCDFGLARTFNDDPPGNYTNMVVTLHYRAPELLLGVTNYDGKAIDMWSIGCIFAELITSKTLFDGTTEPEQLNLIWHYLGTPVPDREPITRSWPEFGNIIASKDFAIRNQPIRRLREKIPPLSPPLMIQGAYLTDIGMDLLERMLTLNPANRISAKNSLLHDWFLREIPQPKKVGEMPEF